MKLVYLDTETTSLDEPGLIQLAYTWQEITKDKYGPILMEQFYFKTDYKIDIGAMAIHHITPKYLSEKGEVLASKKKHIESFLDKSVCIAHNAPFDKRVLEFNEVSNTKFWLDTKNIAYYLLPDAEKYNLQYLRYYIGLEFGTEINPHDALSDVLVIRALFEHLALLEANKNADFVSFEEIPFETLKDIVKTFFKWSSKPLLLREITFGMFKGMDFNDIKELGVVEYREINPKARTGQTGMDYLKYLYGEECKKEEEEQNRDLVYTLSFYLGKEF